MSGMPKAMSNGIAESAVLSDCEERDFEAFEAGTYSPESFHHSRHVRMAWIYLRRLPVSQALPRFSDALQRFALRQGKPDLYHETITWAYLFLINERIAQVGEELGWDQFAQRHPDLLRWKGGLLDELYSRERLFSDLAKRAFILPDRGVSGRGAERE